MSWINVANNFVELEVKIRRNQIMERNEYSVLFLLDILHVKQTIWLLAQM